MRKAGTWIAASSALVIGVGAMVLAGGRTPRVNPGPTLLFNGWGVTPAGQHTQIASLPLKMALSPDGSTLAVVTAGFTDVGLYLLDARTRELKQSFQVARAFNGVAFSADGSMIYVSGGNSNKIYPFHREGSAYVADAGVSTIMEPNVFLAGIAVDPSSGELFVCDEGHRQVLAIDPKSLKCAQQIPVGANPYTCAFGADGTHLYVTNWGEDSVSVVDTIANRVVRSIHVGIRPNDITVSADGRAFVACAGDNSVFVIQTRTLEKAVQPANRMTRPPEGVREQITTSLYPSSPEGSSPDAVAVSPDGSTLYVANADNNDVMVADIHDPMSTHVLGFIPTGWYPSAVAAGPGMVYIGDGKGLGSRPNWPAKLKETTTDHGVKYDYVPMSLEGWVSIVPQPSQSDLDKMSLQVKNNCPYKPALIREASIPSDSVIPDKIGEPCPIKHVLYVVEENRTYDQMYGDFKDAHGRPAGNGDASITMYGEPITPNRHELAREYTLFDNLYVNSEVSWDGHSWTDAGIATDGMQRGWIVNYSGHGNVGEVDNVEPPAAGFIWDLCRKNGLSVKCYGEGTAEYLGRYAVPQEERGTWPDGRDMDRVDGWIKDLHDGEQTGNWPNFMIMSLGEDHTSGTEPGAHTPESCEASNDIGMAKIVAAASRSKFWKSTAIFFIEDDAQDGPDHVDAHRTAGLVISPYVRRGFIDSTMYSQMSMLRTIELILGLPALTQYDAGATPMFNCFMKRPIVSEYNVLTPKVNLGAVNERNAPGAQESQAMDFSDYDKADPEKLNRILWREAKGPNVPYPTPRAHYLAAQ